MIICEADIVALPKPHPQFSKIFLFILTESAQGVISRGTRGTGARLNNFDNKKKFFYVGFFQKARESINISCQINKGDYIRPSTRAILPTLSFFLIRPDLLSQTFFDIADNILLTAL